MTSTSRSDIPDRMTWEELELLPQEIARQIELHDGRVVWARMPKPRHQRFSRRVGNVLERNAQAAIRTGEPSGCWQADMECNVFFNHGKNDFRTPDFVVYHCLDEIDDDIAAHDVVIAGEILSPSNDEEDIENKKAKYAEAGIPWYWQVTLVAGDIAVLRVYALEESTNLPDGIVPLRQRNFIQTHEFVALEDQKIHLDLPFPIDIDWAELRF